MEYIVILVSKNHSTLLYKSLRKRGKKIKLISAPRSITKSCRTAVKFNSEDIEIVKEEIDKNKLKSQGIYKKILKGKRFTYILVK